MPDDPDAGDAAGDNTTTQIRLAQAGDASALDRLLDRWYPIVRNALAARFRDFSLAEDATQEVFLRVAKSLPALRDPGAFGGWVRQLAQNAAIDVLRRREPLPLDDEAWASFPAPAEPAVPETPVVMRALAKLKPSYREVVTLKHVNGMSYTEIAGFLGQSVSAVESLLFKARRALRAEVTKLAAREEGGGA